MSILQESTMLLPILIAHVSWKLARAAVRGDAEAAKCYAELFLYIADPSFARRAGRLATSTASPPSASVERAAAERGHETAKAEPTDEPRYTGFYL